MANPRPPSFEDLEPEGESVLDPRNPADGREFEYQDFEYDELDGFAMGRLGDYEFEEGDEASYEVSPEASYEVAGFEALIDAESLDDAEFLEEERHARPQANLAHQAAHAALKWGGRAKSRSLLRDNGRDPRSRVETACSASIREAQELMDALASAAAAAHNQSEAVGLVAAMVPVALGLEPKAYRALWPSIPALVQGSMGVARLLHRRPATRSGIEVMPNILRETTAQLARRALQGQSVPPHMAARVLAGVTQAALSRRHDRGAKRRRPKRHRSQPYDYY